MVGANLKAETLALMEKRASVEAEMNAIIEILCGPGGPGISGNLVDAEGFPRSDIDIPAVRSQRHRLAELRNDHKYVTAKIDTNLELLHSVKLPNSGSRTPENSAASSLHDTTSQASPMDEGSVHRIPFAIIDEISDASPAAEDGLQLGDMIVKFGNVESGDSLHSRLALEAQSNEGHPVPLQIMRQGSLLNLTVTPKQWHGRGLLGCHFRML
ncbi:26S proteasome non-ATPase regulatory subunit 9 [Dioscorea cayenensis subsp. rotundata]|uniref:26S proteasome non-ATPase regulatory subunit 9 n=1 Tax=Dioscorea cayennensis subsp. rotundata TaxID=55577 RepID=A0AB40AX21_DIOCR|nr:26S proteasome non-ATPase regulatory subunit 9 [Dioscorea cayenensis subsp. rotundata]